MFIDTSAIIALLTAEDKANEIAAALEAAETRITSPLVRLETAVVLATRLDITPTQANALFDEFLAEANVTVLPIADGMALRAVAAYEKFGKGRHPAKLNLADCMSYAFAKEKNMPILFVGSDFSKTDLPRARSK